MRYSNMMIAAVAAASLLAQPVLAEGLAPGKPAGVQKALHVSGMAAVLVGAVIAGAVAISVASGGDTPDVPVTPPASTPTST